MTDHLLEISGLNAYYGEIQILRDVSFNARQGEVISLLGRNGAGKTTVLKSIMGIGPRRDGNIAVRGVETIPMPPHRIARLGIAYCPEERGIFASLTVRENLNLPPVLREGGLSNEEIYTLFPNLRERGKSAGTKLSGGEQQMLAIARILRTGADILLFDEASEGLAPAIVQQIAKLAHRLKRQGFTIVLVEQNLRFAKALSDRCYVMEGGQIIDHLDAGQMKNRASQLEEYLSL